MTEQLKTEEFLRKLDILLERLKENTRTLTEVKNDVAEVAKRVHILEGRVSNAELSTMIIN